jgi:hypothetical protein
MKPCPFCGSLKVEVEIEYQGDTAWSGWAFCMECSCRGPEIYYRHCSKDELRAAAMGVWNVRNNELVEEEVVNDLPATQ